MKYILEGDPVAWARAGRNGKHFYDKQKHIKLVMGITLRNQHGDRPFYTGPLILQGTFFMPIPSRVKNKWEWDGKPTDNIPDTSNLTKLIEDAAIGVLYKDDRIIYKINVERVYGIVPRTEFTFIEVGK